VGHLGFLQDRGLSILADDRPCPGYGNVIDALALD
jgi:hypothetical protein